MFGINLRRKRPSMAEVEAHFQNATEANQRIKHAETQYAQRMAEIDRQQAEAVIRAL